MGWKIGIIIGALFLLFFAFFIYNSSTNRNVSQKLSNISPIPTKAMDTTELKIEELKDGVGDPVKAGDTVEVNYTGTLSDGTKFDSSYDRNQTFKFIVGQGQVIEGWEKGLLGMKKGGLRKLIIPSAMGYGSQGVPGAIPPNSTLIFEIELVSIN